MNPTELWLSGKVRRWHTNAEFSMLTQSNADHQWGVAMVYLALCQRPAMPTLLACLTHDVGERRSADISAPNKRSLPSDLKRAFDTHEAQCRAGVLGASLTDLTRLADDRWVSLCDRIDALLIARLHRPDVVMRDDWVAMRKGVEADAAVIGVLDRFLALWDDEGRD